MSTKKNTNDIKMYSREDKPFGKSWEEWTAIWWQWLLSIPDESNPANDNTGTYCKERQSGPVWFLTFAHSPSAERTCTIPAGKSILFPVATMECSYAEFPKLNKESELRSYAKQGNQVSSMEATIDGLKLQKSDLEKYRIESQLFTVKLPENNIYFWTAPGETQAVSDGYWVFLEPLPPGDHELHFSQVTEDDPTTGTLNCKYDVTYHLKVES
jgi:hypothetical protein